MVVMLGACSDKAKASNDTVQTAGVTATATNSAADREARIAKAKADADAKAKQAASDAACKKWATICETGGGLQFFSKKAECEDTTSGIAKVGVKCDPCKCFE